MIHELHRSDSILTTIHHDEPEPEEYMARGFSLFILATTPLNITMVILGLLYKEECPLDDRIPRYLLFGGIAGLTIVLLRISLVISFRNMDSKHHATHAGMNMARSVMYLFIVFIFIWNLYGSYLLFSSNPELEDTTSSQYCRAVVIKFSYVWFSIFDIATITTIVIWLASLVAACVHPDFLIIRGIQPPPFLLGRYSDIESACLHEEKEEKKPTFVLDQDSRPTTRKTLEVEHKFERKKAPSPSGANRKIQRKLSNRVPDSRRGSCVSTVIITSPLRSNESEPESKKVFTLSKVEDNYESLR